MRTYNVAAGAENSLVALQNVQQCHHVIREFHAYLSLSQRIKNIHPGASLVAQWERICLPMQGTQVRSLIWEDPTCPGARKPVLQNLGATTTDLSSCNYWSPHSLEPLFHNVRSHCNEKPVRCNKRLPTPSFATTRESPRSKEDPKYPKIKKQNYKKYIHAKICGNNLNVCQMKRDKWVN